VTDECCASTVNFAAMPGEKKPNKTSFC